jgi:hypothetical protein
LTRAFENKNPQTAGGGLRIRSKVLGALLAGDFFFNVFEILSDQHAQVYADIPFDAGVGVLFVKEGVTLVVAFLEGDNPGRLVIVKREIKREPVFFHLWIHLHQLILQIRLSIAHG